MILDLFKQRLHAALVRPVPSALDLAAAHRLVTAVNKEGAWPDIDYATTDGPAWKAITHLERVLTLARTRQFCSGEMDAAIVRALDFWLARDFRGPSWWHRWIAVPRLIGSAALLFEGGLSPGARGMVIEILARSRWARWDQRIWSDWHGAHLIGIAFNVLLRGCIEDAPALCHEAFERVHAAVRLARADEEGIQADMSFHQLDGLVSPGDHGLAYAENCARLFILAHGTPWQAPADCLHLFASFLLDGQQWMIRRQFFDGGSSDGEATPKTASLDRFAAAVEELADLGITPRRAEMAAFARRLRNPLEPALSGHRHFWRSDLTVHQRPAFYTSVRLGSRLALPDGSHIHRDATPPDLAAGLTYLLRDGQEYRDISPVWDRRRLPGTTVLQSTAVHASPRSGLDDGPTFVGGVTDGEYGVAVMELRRDTLHARKAWFHFDDSFVCLGASIACDDEAAPVFTSINQCLLRGPVIVYGKGGETHDLVPGKSYDLSAAHRLEHDGVAYHFPELMPVRARLSPQTSAQDTPGEPITRDVFSVWIDHGIQPRRDGYAYTVLPAGSPDAPGACESEAVQIEILANHSALQAVWHRALRLVGIVFWEPGIVPLPGGGRVAANRPCAVLCQDRRPEGMRLSIANPTKEAATIHVEYANRCLCFDLPGGQKGGQSVTRVL